jgi:predicted MFS family arabinose efflux permease
MPQTADGMEAGAAEMAASGVEAGAAVRAGEPSFRHSVALVYGVALIQGAFGVTIAASSSVLRQRLALGDTLYGALFLPALLLAMATSLVGHELLRRWSLRKLFLFSLAAEAVSLSLMALAGAIGRPLGLPMILAGLALAGPAMGAFGITLNTAAIELFPGRRDGALTAMHGFLGAGAAVWPMAVAAAAGLRAWPTAPLLLAGLFAVALALSLRRPLRGVAEEIHPAHAQSHVPRRLGLRSLTALVYGISEATFTAWAVIYLYEQRGFPAGVAAGALSAFWLTMTAGRLLAAAMVRWSTPVRLTLVLAMGMSLAFLLVARAHSAAGALLAFGFAGLACSAVFPLLLSLGSADFPERTPQVSAIFSAAVLAGISIGTFAVGPLRGQLGLERIYTISAAGPLVMVLLVLLMAQRSRRAS